MAALNSPGMARRRILTPYVLIWIAVACLALIYLVLLGMRPNVFANVARSAADIERQVAQLKRDVVRGFADIEPVRQTVGEVKMEVDNLKVAAQEASDRDRIIMEKVAALETSASKERDAAPPAGAGKDSAASPSAVPPTPHPDPRKSAAAKPAKPITATAATKKQKDAKVLNGTSAPAIETGSISAAKAAPAAKAATPAKSPVGVLLATGPSVDALRLNWSILTDRHADAVKNLQPRYVVSGKANERSYGLVAGPVESTAEAANVCKVMEERGVPCEISLYRGNAL